VPGAAGHPLLPIEIEIERLDQAALERLVFTRAIH